jgi:SAM-dependent methyltransferase
LLTDIAITGKRMRQIEAWRPTKFALIDGCLRGEPTGLHLSVGSRLLGDMVAPHYEAALRSHARGRLLDLGCGSVPLFGVYRELVDETICIDWPSSLHEKRHVDAFADLTKPLPLADASFDTVLLTDVLEHIPNPETLMREVGRVLRKGGTALIGVPFFYWLHETPHDFNRYTRYQLERMVKSVGLELKEITEVGGSPAVVAGVIAKTLAPRPRLAWAFVKFAEWALKQGNMRKLSERTRSLFPITYVVAAGKPVNY